jgi:4-hydroxy-tetrahydrodipicolinate reductase
MTKIIINGACGRMGRMIAQAAREEAVQVVAGIDSVSAAEPVGFPLYASLDQAAEAADVLIDFSCPQALESIIAYCEKTGCACVLATTAYSPRQEADVRELSKKVAVFRSSNMSLGVNLLLDLIRKAAASLEGFDVEIVEKHHNTKADSPSGTAFMLAEAANQARGGKLDYTFGRHARNERRKKDEIGIHAVRGGTLTGEHSVLFIGTDEVIEINHTAYSRMVFAKGAVRAARFIADKGAGLYTMKDVIE